MSLIAPKDTLFLRPHLNRAEWFSLTWSHGGFVVLLFGDAGAGGIDLTKRLWLGTVYGTQKNLLYFLAEWHEVVALQDREKERVLLYCVNRRVPWGPARRDTFVHTKKWRRTLRVCGRKRRALIEAHRIEHKEFARGWGMDGPPIELMDHEKYAQHWRLIDPFAAPLVSAFAGADWREDLLDVYFDQRVIGDDAIQRRSECWESISVN